MKPIHTYDTRPPTRQVFTVPDLANMLRSLAAARPDLAEAFELVAAAIGIEIDTAPTVTRPAWRVLPEEAQR